MVLKNMIALAYVFLAVAFFSHSVIGGWLKTFDAYICIQYKRRSVQLVERVLDDSDIPGSIPGVGANSS